MGIWVAILLSETIPVLIYAGIATYLQKSHENEIKSILLLQDSKSINFTYDKNQKEDSQEFFEKIEKIFGDYAPIFLSSMDAICGNIFDHDSSLNQIDVTVRLVEGNAVVLFVDDGSYIIYLIIKSSWNLKPLKN